METNLTANQLEPQIGQVAGVEAVPVHDSDSDGQNANVQMEANAGNDPTVAGQTANVEANPRKRKESLQRSVVWDHFDSIRDGKGVIMQAKRKYCARMYNCNAKKMAHLH
ncbi:uncharacterized protein LOC126665798 [Mercurialis annua]|uniref:uncharacterized protein LOC126665798 n=1 Tax=Mercurialis annua TaxID=3986 RepID=UPI00215F5A8F|nr:uncharacterized protein LOC126665798 [Mercurialis annua]